jgi:hypothetical protein
VISIYRASTLVNCTCIDDHIVVYMMDISYYVQDRDRMSIDAWFNSVSAVAGAHPTPETISILATALNNQLFSLT